MGELIKIVGGPSMEDKIIPAITTPAADKTWRIRLAAVQFFPKLALTVGRDLFQAKLQNVILGMLMDPVFTIRETALESLLKVSLRLLAKNTDWDARKVYDKNPGSPLCLKTSN